MLNENVARVAADALDKLAATALVGIQVEADHENHRSGLQH
jgi:hypothetical protein